MSLVGNIIRFVVERRAKKSSLEEVRAGLQSSGEQIAARMEKAAGTPANRNTAAHVIGIERWGARRLKTALGEAPVMEEYDGYRPDTSLAMPALAAAFRQARAETLELAGKLSACQDERVRHNDLGMISVKVWLVYLQSHAEAESKKIS